MLFCRGGGLGGGFDIVRAVEDLGRAGGVVVVVVVVVLGGGGGGCWGGGLGFWFDSFRSFRLGASGWWVCCKDWWGIGVALGLSYGGW